MRPSSPTTEIQPSRPVSFLIVASLLMALLPTAPASADPPDVTYSYDFTGDNEAPWGSGWTHLSSDPSEPSPYLDDDRGVLDGSEHGAVSLRPETASDGVQKLKVIFSDPDDDGQVWGLAMRSDGSGYWSDSGYYCVLDYEDNDENALLYMVRVSNGVRVWLDEPEEVALSGDVWLKCEAQGSDLRAKVWADGASEPGAWNVEVTDSTYATGRMGVLLDSNRSVEVIVDDYSLEGYSSSPVPPPDPGGGGWYADTFTGDSQDGWASGWTHLASGSPLPYLGGGSGILDSDDDELQVTSLRSDSYTDSEQLVRVIWYPEESRHWGLVVRHDGEGDVAQSGYYCTLSYDEDVNDGEPTLRILRYNGGSATVLDDVEIDVATNQWLKCVAEGTTIRAKTWDTSTTEPSVWDLEVTDATYSSGRVGTFLYGDGDTVRLDDYRLGPDVAGDVTDPVVQVLSPADGAAISDSATVEVQATDDVGVTQVELLIDGAVAGSLTSPDTDGIYRFNETFDTSGRYELSARATDAADNIGDSAVVTVTVPAEALPSTYFVFTNAQTMTDVFDMLETEGLHPVEFEHVVTQPNSVVTMGGFYAPDLPAADQEAYYQAFQHDKYGVDPAIISVRVGGTHAASSLGDLSNEVDQTVEVPALSGDGENDGGQGTQGSFRTGATQTNMQTATAREDWWPDTGVVKAFDSVVPFVVMPPCIFLCPPITLLQPTRNIAHEFEWQDQEAIDLWTSGFAYEHDFKLFNATSDPDTVHPFCGLASDDFWTSRITLWWDTTLPFLTFPYLDTGVEDPCTESDFTIGILLPTWLDAGTYTTEIRALPGEVNESPYELIAQHLGKSPGALCPFKWCVNVPGSGPEDDQDLVTRKREDGSDRTVPIVCTGWSVFDLVSDADPVIDEDACGS